MQDVESLHRSQPRPALGDQRLDLCDLYAFQSRTDPAKTVLILNANPNADALHPDAIYRLNIDSNGDYSPKRRSASSSLPRRTVVRRSASTSPREMRPDHPKPSAGRW
ncbi:DUF4331 family protein [Streptomyces sp. NPDC101149]|uniref:DUF4331 family protein n=1 Tax=Streptomyces sp. NPDC101149 TaxID=3366113 RepID=UPI00380089C7